MNIFFESFNNREIATFIWALILILFLLFFKKVRMAFFKVLRTLFTIKLIEIYITVGLYLLLVIWIFFKFSLWYIELLKTTLIWFLGTGMVLVFSYQKMSEGGYTKILIKRTFKWTLILEFMVGFSSFSLTHELIFIPCLLILGVLTTYFKTDKKYTLVYRLLNPIFVSSMLFIFAWSIVRTVSHFRIAFTFNNLLEIFLPPILTIILIPYLYVLAGYIGYQSIFALEFFRGDFSKGEQRKIKKIIFSACGLNLRKINIVRKNIYRIDVRNDQELNVFLHRFHRQ